MEETLRTLIPYSKYFVLRKGVSVIRIDTPTGNLLRCISNQLKSSNFMEI